MAPFQLACNSHIYTSLPKSVAEEGDKNMYKCLIQQFLYSLSEFDKNINWGADLVPLQAAICNFLYYSILKGVF